jgi:CheY-like chemotaxis protein
MFRTLLVEDNLRLVVFRDNLQLQFFSMAIAEAADGVEALEKIRSFPQI